MNTDAMSPGRVVPDCPFAYHCCHLTMIPPPPDKWPCVGIYRTCIPRIPGSNLETAPSCLLLREQSSAGRQAKLSTKVACEN